MAEEDFEDAEEHGMVRVEIPLFDLIVFLFACVSVLFAFFLFAFGFVCRYMASVGG